MEIDIEYKSCPDYSWSCIKSIDQHSLIAFGTVNGLGFARIKRFLGLIRKFKDNSQ